MRIRLLLVLLASALAGCHTVRETVRSVLPQPPPPPRPKTGNFYSPPLPDKSRPMRRVAMLPLSGEKLTPEVLRDITTAFQAELSKKAIFEVVPIGGTELEAICGQRQLSSVEPMPAQLLDSLRERYGAEGILFTDITHLHAYRPVAIGVRAKLVDIGSGAISWACDCVYDSGHPAIAENARQFQRQFSDPQRAIPDDGGSVLISPMRFAKFVASATFNSLEVSPELFR